MDHLRKSKTRSFTALEAFACYVEYGDEGAHDITKREKQLFDTHVESIVERMKERYPKFQYMHCSTDTDLSEEFGRCEVTGLRGRVCEYALVFMRSN